MKRIFENAKFGDQFKTRDGRKAIFISQSKYGSALLIVKYLDGYEEFRCNEHGSHINNSEAYESIYDIVSEWQEEINEEELKTKAHDAAMKYYPKERESDNPEIDSMIRSIYMDGFIDCFNELNGGKE